MTRHFDYCPSASESDNQSVRSSAPVVSRCFPGGYNVKLYISRGPGTFPVLHGGYRLFGTVLDKITSWLFIVYKYISCHGTVLFHQGFL